MNTTVLHRRRPLRTLLAGALLLGTATTGVGLVSTTAPAGASGDPYAGCPSAPNPSAIAGKTTLRDGAASVGLYQLCKESVDQARGPKTAAAIKIALSRLGVRYSQPDRDKPGAYDCSSFVSWAHRSAGTSVLGSTGWTPTTYTFLEGKVPGFSQVPTSQRRPGDLVFPSRGHVAMQLARGFIVHTNATGDVSHVKAGYTSPAYAVALTSDAWTNSPPAANPNRVGYVDASGGLHVKEGPLNATWTKVAASGVASFDLDGTRIAALMTNGDLLVKEGPLNATWTKVGTGVTHYDLEGNRIAVRWNSGQISAKEGTLGAPWTTLTSGTSVRLEGDRVAVGTSTGGLVVKAGPLNAGWTTVATSGVSSFDLEGTRLAIRRSNGDLLVREGALTAASTLVANGVTGYDLEGNRIAVRWTSGQVSAKEGGIGAPWVALTSGTAVELEGDRIAVRSTAGGLSVKAGPLNAGWVTVVSSGVSSFDLSD